MIKLLVANRGEIAVRIMATASVPGVATVAVYAADDAACGHVGRADAAVELPGTGPAAYLDVDAVVTAATSAGCALRRGGGALRPPRGRHARAVRRQEGGAFLMQSAPERAGYAAPTEIA